MTKAEAIEVLKHTSANIGHDKYGTFFTDKWVEAYEMAIAALREPESKTLKFVLNGCDISFIAEAPADITLEQLLKQCDKIHPDWCACGICSLEHEGYSEDHEPEIIITYDSVRKADDDVSFSIKEVP
jgi:hypothetical protein